MDQDLIKRYIAYPMAIKVLNQDIEKFNEFRLGNLYQDMLESIIERMHWDFYKLKPELNSVHHIHIARIDNGKYNINNEVVEFTPEEMKGMTKQLVGEYLYGEKARGFERKERIWSEDK